MGRRAPPPPEIGPLAEMLVHPEPEVQRQGQDLLGVMPELAGTHLRRALESALWRRVSAEQRATIAGRIQHQFGKPDCARFAARWVWAWRFCVANGLAWAEVRLAMCAGRTQRSRWARWWRVVVEGGVLRVELGDRRMRRELVLPVPSDHPLRGERVRVRDLGRAYAEGIDVYLPVPGEE